MNIHTLSIQQVITLNKYIDKRLQLLKETYLPYLRTVFDQHHLDKHLLFLYSVFIAEIEYTAQYSYINFIHQKVDIVFKMWDEFINSDDEDIQKDTYIKEFIQELCSLIITKEHVIQRLILDNISIKTDLNTYEISFSQIVLNMYTYFLTNPLNHWHYRIIWNITSLFSKNCRLSDMEECLWDSVEIIKDFSEYFTQPITAGIMTLNRLIYEQVMRRENEMTNGVQRMDYAL